MRYLIILLLTASAGYAQNLPCRWDELTASDWPKALESSKSTCILPIGILEKHGPHDPIGADLIQVHEWASRLAAQEYVVLFPDYFFGQIYEARHQPGAFALPSKLLLELLDATCSEIARNGFRKILILNSHGGNPYLLRFFIQSQLERRRDYVVYLYEPSADQEFARELSKARQTDPSYDWHAGETETSSLLYFRPDLVQMDRAGSESGENQKRLSLPDLYTAIWWYADFPNHYAGVAAKAAPALGKLIEEHRIKSLVKALQAVKADTSTLRIQSEFFDRVGK